MVKIWEEIMPYLLDINRSYHSFYVNADYNAGYYGEEELKAPPLQKYIAGKLS